MTRYIDFFIMCHIRDSRILAYLGERNESTGFEAPAQVYGFVLHPPLHPHQIKIHFILFYMRVRYERGIDFDFRTAG